MGMFDYSGRFSLHLGTMGFGYPDWNGYFYPEEMDAGSYLSYYSRIFTSVEIDSTFYGTPRLSTIDKWLQDTPQNFKYSVKVPRSITHEPELENTWGLMAEFLETVLRLGERLGVVLLQFAPSFTFSQIGRLSSFIDRLPGGFRFAIEVRHQSWYEAEQTFVQLLSERGIAWAATQYPNLPEKIHAITDFVYIRWIGQHGMFLKHYQEQLNRQNDLLRWGEYLDQLPQSVKQVFGYFNNDYAGNAAATALRFMSLAGLAAEIPQRATQPRLF
jgi:uncharacterized protein YecE (DUF72 family)